MCCRLFYLIDYPCRLFHKQNSQLQNSCDLYNVSELRFDDPINSVLHVLFLPLTNGVTSHSSSQSGKNSNVDFSDLCQLNERLCVPCLAKSKCSNMRYYLLAVSFLSSWIPKSLGMVAAACFLEEKL